MRQWLPLLRLHLANYCNQTQHAFYFGTNTQNLINPQVSCVQTARTLQDEYTPSFSSFFGRGDERSCAFFAAIRADPPAAPEPSVPPAPGAAGTRPAAPMAGEPCWIPALSAMRSPRNPKGSTGPGETIAPPSALFHKRRIRHGAHPYFQFQAEAPFSSTRGRQRDQTRLKCNSRGHKIQPIGAKIQGQMQKNVWQFHKISTILLFKENIYKNTI